MANYTGPNIVNETQDPAISTIGLNTPRTFPVNNTRVGVQEPTQTPVAYAPPTTSTVSAGLPPVSPTNANSTTTTNVIVGEGNTVIQTSDNAVIYINNNDKDTIYITEVTEQYNQQFITNRIGSNVGGNNGQIQFNNNGVIDGAADLVYLIGQNSLFAGKIIVGSSADLGDAANVKILGGDPGYVLTTDGTGNLRWTAGGGGAAVAGSNTQVQFNDRGSFGATANFTFSTQTNTLSADYFSGDGSNLSNVPGGGLVRITNVTQTNTYLVTPTDQTLVIRSVGPLVVGLPSPVQVGRRIVIKDFLGNNRIGNAISIVPTNPVDTIDGGTGFSVDDPYNVVTVVGVSDTEWMIL